MNQQFYDHYSSIYGERWEQLVNALREAGLKTEKVSVCLKSNFDPKGELQLQNNELVAFSGTTRSEYYQLDVASALAVTALNLTPQSKILDLCAAPGGKSLVSQLILNGEGEWHLNELSQDRLSRMKSVMRQFSPVPEGQLYFYKRDASKWGMMEKGVYDTILCDVPCSGEAHLLNSPSHMNKWTPKSSKNLAVRQHAILCSALDAVKPGGEILYSTCSISPLENDGVIQKFLKKRGDRVEILRPELEQKWNAEATEYGINLFPDRSQIGPIYFSIIKSKNM